MNIEHERLDRNKIYIVHNGYFETQFSKYRSNWIDVTSRSSLLDK